MWSRAPSHHPWSGSTIDWETPLAFRNHLWRLGLKIAEATDTSQRGMGLDWCMAKELIRRSLAEAKTVAGADLACGAGTDQLVTNETRSLGDVVRAYEEQIGHVEAHGGRVMPALGGITESACGARFRQRGCRK